MKKFAMLLALVCLFSSWTPGLAYEETKSVYLFLDIPFGSSKDAVTQAIKDKLGVQLEVMVVTFAEKAETSATPFHGGHGLYPQ